VNRRFVALLIILAIAVLGTTLVFAQAKKAPETVVLKASMGNVTFNHKTHVTAAKKCDTCHHASKPEKAATAPQQACSDCHTKVAAAPMKTKLQAAFHNPAATAGTCIDCHKTQGKGPVKCADCHKKA
jgi:hypothetical protein